jgi:plasmid segregation protein ParM
MNASLTTLELLMNQSLSVLAVDVGYGNVKFVKRLADGKIERRMFPALAPAHLAGTVSTHEFSTKRDTVVVRVDGNNYEVGFDVRDAITPTNSGGDLSDEYTKTPNYTALLYGAIAYSGADTIDCLSLGLPVHIYNQKVPQLGTSSVTTVAQVLKNKYLGKQSFGARAIEIKDVVVIPQPIGTLFWHKQ